MFWTFTKTFSHATCHFWTASFKDAFKPNYCRLKFTKFFGHATCHFWRMTFFWPEMSSLFTKYLVVFQAALSQVVFLVLGIFWKIIWPWHMLFFNYLFIFYWFRAIWGLLWIFGNALTGLGTFFCTPVYQALSCIKIFHYQINNSIKHHLVLKDSPDNQQITISSPTT